MAVFLHRHVFFYRASLQYPMSVMVIDPVCPQAISPMRVALFPSGMSCVTNIPSISCNDTLFGSEFNGKHAYECFMQL